MKKKLISVIIPAYNEEKVIYNSLTAIENQLLSMKRPFEILVVNDTSTDSTLKIVEGMIKKRKRNYLRIITYKDGPSRRENLARSFKLLKGEYIMLLDMDVAM
ncbi:MAG TPA: glycosyltransferase, partial [Gemmatimonadetes bacterium]|nr:glycosyltransferase [Gemmatimonadota bacterium]